MEPLLPRLHVKDTEKGGAKPPPRNKMAVYEELITPSSRFINGSTIMQPLQPNGASPIHYASSGSSRQVGESDRTLSAVYSLPASTHWAPRLVRSSESDRIFSNISAHSVVKPLGYTISSISGNSMMTSLVSHSTPPILPLGPSPFSVTAGVSKRAVQGRRAGSGMLINTNESGNNSVHRRIVHRYEDVSPTTEVNYVTSVVISPDDVILKLGQQNFCKIRRILVRQQRIFSIQVFELHRLVQKSLAGSSHHSVENSLCLQNRLDEVSNKEGILPPPPNLPSVLLPQHPLAPPPLSSLPTHVQPNDPPKTSADNSLVKIPFLPILYNSVKGPICRRTTTASSMVIADDDPCSSSNPPTSPPPPPPPPSLTESIHLSLKTSIAPENSLEKHLLPPLSSNSSKLSLSGHRQSSKSTATSVGTDKSITPCSYSLTTPPLPLTQSSVSCPKTATPPGHSLGTMLQTTCFHPLPEKQWLVPLMSSEGLVYKPYPGPCPPNAAGFTAHLLGTCGSVNIPPGGGSYYLNAAYGMPDATQQGKGMVAGIPITMPYLDPCGFSSANLPPRDEAAIKDMSSCLPCFSSRQKVGFWNGSTVPGSIEGDRQGSTGSSSVERASREALPLFPLEPFAAQELESGFDSEKLTQAIKAMPCDGGLASKYAKRIFQSIQEERK
uniref:Arabidopsis ELF3 homolog n=1 Tax=Fagopyrum urophyllum TaxID=62331 RepID=H3JUC9_9CARY|nr:arabidopsis ELF3 homolog [Fagopyrum urophyllum]